MNENDDDNSSNEENNISDDSITIEYQEEELNIKNITFDINIKVSNDNNIIKFIFTHKNYKSEIYEYIMNKVDFLKIFPEYQNKEISIKDYLYQIDSLFKNKKVIIKYKKNLYNLSLFLLLEDKIELNFDKKITNVSNIEFKSIPCLKFKETIYSNNCGGGCNSIFDVYLCYNDSKQYLASSNYTNYNIDITSLENNQLILSLKGHKNEIYSIRYFINKVDKHEYLISSDANKVVIVWNILRNYKIIFNLLVKYSYYRNIYSCMIINLDSFNYVIISSYTSEKTNYSENTENDCTKMYSLFNKIFIKNIYNTNNNCTRYLLSWYNTQNDNNYIIECCDSKISINNLLKKENYCTFESAIEGEEYLNGFIFTKNNRDFLLTGSWNGYVRIWDLFEKNETNYIKTQNCELYHLINWSNKFAIIANKFMKFINVIDIGTLEIVLIIKNKNLKGIKCIKKIIHPKYGESLLTCSEDGKINLFVLYNNI